MKRLHDCITDPLTKQWWRDYKVMCKEGNPLGLSFTQYVAHHVVSVGQRLTDTATDQTPWYIASCGHKHLWGESCATWTEA